MNAIDVALILLSLVVLGIAWWGARSAHRAEQDGIDEISAKLDILLARGQQPRDEKGRYSPWPNDPYEDTPLPFGEVQKISVKVRPGTSTRVLEGTISDWDLS